jgi:uncharacterized membrane protein YqaE (UPF0057 family)
MEKLYSWLFLQDLEDEYAGIRVNLALYFLQYKLSGTRPTTMRLIIALILPWLTFFTIGRPIAGIICLILQITVIGWLPATIWAVYALSQFKTDQKIEKAMRQRG